MEILAGILNNQESENQSLLCIRDLVFIDEQIKNEMTEYCNNKKESEVLELKSLKERTLTNIPYVNIFELTVKIKDLIKLFNYLLRLFIEDY